MKLDDISIKQLSEIAKSAAVEAGEYIQTQLNQQHQSRKKVGGTSLASQIVTEVDDKAQSIILGHLAKSIQQFDLGLLTEEAVDDASRLEKDYFWCVDPLDGTLSFSEGRTGYAVSIALVAQAGDPVIGVVYVPDSADCYSAIKGKGLELNEEPFVLNTLDDHILHFCMDRSLQADTHFEHILTEMEAWAKSNNNTAIQQHRGYGAVCNAIGVINSAFGCYFKIPQSKKGGGSIWDFASTRLFFEELGLPVSNAFGEPLGLNKKGGTFMNKQGVVYANNRIIYEWLLQNVLN